jgi:hypothetical protein
MASQGRWQRSSAALWASLTLLGLIVLYFGLRLWGGERDASAGAYRSYSLLIAAPRPGEELTILPARQNESVTLRIRSDRAGEVHVHGYDQNVTLAAGSEAVLTFTAKQTGIYPIHLHERLNPADPDTPMLHRQLAILEVKGE